VNPKDVAEEIVRLMNTLDSEPRYWFQLRGGFVPRFLVTHAHDSVPILEIDYDDERGWYVEDFGDWR
jgi:hypothetical protein